MANVTGTWIFVVFLSFVLVQNGQSAVQKTGTVKSPRDLHQDLFKNYDASVLPVKVSGNIVNVSVGLQPLFIRELDEEKEIFVLDAWVFMKWKDSNLAWNPDHYGGIESLNIPSTEVWKPDVTSYLASPDKKLLPLVLTNAILYSSGDVLWVPPFSVQTRCPLDLSDFPNDIQRCTIKLGSWTFGSKSMNLQLYETSVKMDIFLDHNPRWKMIATTVDREDKFYPCCPNESYPALNYNFTIQRRISPPVRIGTCVAYFATFLAALMFLLPPDSTHKALLGALSEVLLGMVVLFLGSTVAAPEGQIKAAERVYPFMCAVAGALLIEMLIMNIARIMGPCRPSRCIVAMAKGCCQPLGVCIMRPYPGGDLKTESAYAEKPKKPNATAQEEWNLVAMVLDRIMFVTSVIVIFMFKIY